MLDEAEFTRRVDENTYEFRHQINQGNFDLMKFHGADMLKGEASRIILSSKTHDLLSAILLGFLPILKSKTGSDAIKMVNGQCMPVELKSSYTDESKFIKTKNNSIFSVKTEKILDNRVPKSKTTSLKSAFNATYKIKNNVAHKNIDTYLVLFDSRTDNVIDCFMIDGTTMGNYLAARPKTESGSVTVKLTTFEKLGKQISDMVVTPIGFDTWKKSLTNLPEIHVYSEPKIDIII